MSQADQIRRVAIDIFIQPARQAGQSDVIIRAGDVHRQMGLANAMPAVCSALRSAKFEQAAAVRRVEVTGPANGANVYFRFAFAPVEAKDGAHIGTPQTNPTRSEVVKAEAGTDLDFKDAIVLVSCVKSKLPIAAPARTLYCSDWFVKARHLVERSSAPWFILSARYGLVSPDKKIEPYELTLNKMGIHQRRAWADEVFKALEPELPQYRRVIFFAGIRYREFLAGRLLSYGLHVDIPMEGLAQGKQLSWMGARQ